jgi:excisionase family DNA binding protein
MGEHLSLMLSIAEAAAALGIGEQTARDLIRRGDFPVPVREVGGRRKVSRHLLEQWCDSQESAAS